MHRSPCQSPEQRHQPPPPLTYMELLRYHELCQTLCGHTLWTAAPWLPSPSQPVTWHELAQRAAAAPPELSACPASAAAARPGDCSHRPAAQEANTGGRGRRAVSDFSIAGILADGRRSPTPPAAAAAAAADDDRKSEYDWLNCTRYKPPKLPRPKKEGGAQKRRLGRNPRIPFSSHQIALLEHRFRHKQYLSSYDVTELASLLCLSQTRVKIWFQNRRARERRDHESRARAAALPLVPSYTVLPCPSTPSPTTVVPSIGSAFHPVPVPPAAAELGSDEQHEMHGAELGLQTGPDDVSLRR